MMESQTGLPQHAPAPAAEVAVVYAGDYVNKMSAQRIERECRQRLEGGCSALVINFKGTELVNSIGVSVLLGVVDDARVRGARVIFSDMNRHTVKLFDLLGLTRHVAMAENEAAAIATLSEFIESRPQNGH